MSGLIDTITSQLTGSGLVARDNSGKLQIYEPGSPYAGGSITHSALPASAFGSAPLIQQAQNQREAVQRLMHISRWLTPVPRARRSLAYLWGAATEHWLCEPVQD
jgi:hypothetical protein